jgi:chromosome segregation protein
LRIKKIELIGFKSFKDRTVIQFDSGITGVVGPNGCGKSNIVDALLWVMGEMSAKDLRGSSMIDVIFAGSEGFAPSGLAEVSLTLENDGGPFPIKYQKYSEVMVTRRLHRNGESEYFINKEVARLRDIQEIFMDTGAGSKGFSIIQQGMIGRIITSKPEERRVLIEEAAGITKFKVRKKESQRKLQATDQNLLRLADIVGELKRQIESLKRQSERAERYRHLKNQMETLDLKLASLSYQNLQQEALGYAERATSLDDQKISMETQIQEGSSRIETLKLQVQELENQRDSKTQAQSDKQLLVQKIELEIQKLEFELQQARTKGEMTGSMIQVQKLRATSLAEEVSLYENQVQSLESSIESLEVLYTQQNEAFKEQESRDQELDEDLTQLRQKLFALGQAESQIEARIQAGQAQIQDIEDRLKESQDLEQELLLKQKELESRHGEIQKEFHLSQEQTQEVKQQISQVEAQYESQLCDIQNTKKEWETFKLSLGEVSSRLSGLEELDRNFEGFQEGVKQVILWNQKKVASVTDGLQLSQESGLQGVSGGGGEKGSGLAFHNYPQSVFQTVSEVIEVPSEFEIALEATLGHRLQMLLSPEKDLVLDAVDYLKKEKKGRASFALMGSDFKKQKQKKGFQEISSEGVILLKTLIETEESLSPIVDRLLSRVAVVESLNQALALKEQYEDWTFVTREGDLLSEEGVLTAGFGQSPESGLLKRRREIKDLRQKKSEWSGKLALCSEVLNKQEQKKQELEFQLESLRKNRDGREQELVRLNKELDRAEIEVRNIKQTLERVERETFRISEQLSQAFLRQEALEQSRQETVEKKQELSESSFELQAELENLRLGFSSLREKVMELQIQLTEKKTQCTSGKENLKRVSSDLALVTEEVNRMAVETEQVGESLSHNQVLLEEKRRQFQISARELEDLRSQVSVLNSQYEELDFLLQEELDQNQSLQSQLNKQFHDANEANLRLEQTKMKEQVLIEQIRERYLLNLPDLWTQYLDSAIEVKATEDQLKDLKEKVAKIGDVNLSAIEEYKKTSERYEFLVSQQNDLIEAKDQLRRVIDRINRICSKRFKETFDLVNERFTQVFPVLFGGGEARLELVEDPEKSEMGIDIIAKPPGKKMQNVSLLSGGEKALTAVSLVFSIFLVKPSPYCLLDEVDAPLDDANVSRFNDLVREMSKRSQIIVVTHNKHTMEIASKLYGVTMQSRGVSTMVSVNLNEV